MDRGWEIPRASGKRSFDEYDSDAGRRLESQLRGRLEYAEERRQRSREADRDYGRRRSPEWHRGEERRHEDERRFEAGPSFVTEQFSKKKVGVRKFSARSRAAAGNPTPTPSPPVRRRRAHPHLQASPPSLILQNQCKVRRRPGSNVITAAKMATTNLAVYFLLTAVFAIWMDIPRVCVLKRLSSLFFSGMVMLSMGWASTAWR
jgi:hypothetical protein